MIAFVAFTLILIGMALGHFLRCPILIGPFTIDEVIPSEVRLMEKTNNGIKKDAEELAGSDAAVVLGLSN